MAEEVKIVDVAGGPAAEATLQELLKVVKSMAAKSGGTAGGASAANKVQNLYSDAVNKGTTAKKTNTKEVNANTSAFKKATSAVAGFAKGILSGFSSILGYGIGVVSNFFDVLTSGTGTLTDFVSQIPLIGSLLAKITGIFDDTLLTFQQLSTTGASFNNNLTQLRVSAAGAKVSLDSFSSLVSSNAEFLSNFGGTVTQGAQRFVRVRKAMEAYESQLLGMGLSFEEINESLMSYMTLQRAGSRAEEQSVEALAAASTRYTTNLMTLAKLTGNDIKSQREKLAAQSADIAFQMKLAKLRPEEREKVMAGLAEAMAAGGETGAQYFKQQFLGLPPLTRATRLFEATMGDSAKAIRRMNSEATNASVSVKQFSDGQVSRLADFLEGAARAGDDLETVLATASGGMEGIGAELADIFKQQGKNFNDYVKFENGRRVFDRAAFEKDVKAAKAETNRRDELVQGLTGFQSTLRKIRETIELYIIAPIGRAVGPQLNRLAELFKSANETTLKPAIQKIGDMIQKFTSDIQTFGFKKALSNLFAEIGKEIKPAFESMLNGLKAMLFGQSAAEVKKGLADTKESLTANAADIQKQIDALNTKLPTLKGAKADEAKAQIAALQEQLGRVNAEIAKTDKEMKTATGTSGLFGSMFGSLWERIKEMNWAGIALALGLFTAAIVGLGAAAKPVILPLIAIGAAAAGIGLAGEGLSKLIDSITGSFGRMADGLERLQKLDPAKLLDLGKSLGPLTDNLTSLAVGGIVASFVGEKTFENLASGLTALSEVNGQLLEQLSVGLTELNKPLFELAKAGIVANFVGKGVLEGLAKGVKSFQDVDPSKLYAVGPALESLHRGISAFTGNGVLDSAGKALSNFFSGLFGGGGTNFDGLIKSLKSFDQVDSDKIFKIGLGLEGIANFAGKDVEIGKLKVSAEGLENLNKITKTLDSNNIDKYNKSLDQLVKVLGKLNEELSSSEGATPGTTTAGKNASTVLAKMGGNREDQIQKLDQLNNTMTQILFALQEGNEYGKRTSKAIRANGNLQMGI